MGDAQRRPRQRGQDAEDSLSTRSDTTGNFALTLPSAGSWQIYATASGFRRQAFDRHDGFFSAVVLTPEIPTHHILFRLEPDSSISGFIRDEGGEAIRGARVNLSAAEVINADPGENVRSSLSATMTDDRGHYEFSGLAPGDYNVGVQAQPWYATSSQGRPFTTTASAGPPDPSLDVVYPETWFPGVLDRRLAESLSLHHGDTRQADFDLTPVPATHLRIAVPVSATSGARGQITPQVEKVSSTGSSFLNTPVRVDAQGQIDVDGLSAGLYRVSMPSSDGVSPPAFLRVTPGAEHTLDLAAAIPVAEIKYNFEPDVESNHVQIVMTEMESGLVFTSFAQGGFARRRGGGAEVLAAGERKLEVVPGRYRVSVAGDDEIFLDGMIRNTTPVEGRVVSVSSGKTNLTLKVIHGRATVQGRVSKSGSPLSGVMVMLVPATYGRPESIPVLRRDQTNTDGSFLIETVIPGDYILLAIDGGWEVNWHDPSTLARYLVHGVALTLRSGAHVKQEVEAQSP